MIILDWKLFLSASLYLHLVSVFFVTKIIGIKGFMATPYIRLGVLAPVLLAYITYFLFKKMKINSIGREYSGRAFEKLFFLLLVSSFFSGLSNHHFYFITDLVYFLIFLFGILLTGSNLSAKKPNFNKIFSHLYNLAKNCSIIGLFFLLLGIPIPKTIHVFLFSFFSCLFLSSGFFSFKKAKVIYLIFFVLSVITLNRAFYLQALVILLLLVVFTTPILKKIKIVSFSLATILILLQFIGNMDFIKGSNLERRINESVTIFNEGINEKTSIPMLQRIHEVESIKANFDNNPMRYIFGFGFGATIDMTNSIDGSLTGSQIRGAENTHNIHFLHAAILYRHGIVGILIYLFVILFCLVNVIQLGKKLRVSSITEKKFVFLLANIYVIGLAIYSSTASSSLFTDPLLPLMLAIACYAKPKTHRFIKKDIYQREYNNI